MISSCLSKMYNTCVNIKNVPERYARELLHLCVFQHPENAGRFQRTVFRIYKIFSQCICSSGYQFDRAERGWKVLEELGATKLSGIRVDNNLIDAMKWDSKSLKEKIENLGGSWGKHTLSDGQIVLGIVPPQSVSQEWEALERSLFKFWPDKKEGMIITCASADEINDHKKLMIKVNSASTSYVMMSRIIAKYVGRGIDVVCFDPPGAGLSKGRATEGVYYTAIKAVFDRVESSYSRKNIWVAGTCLGCTSVAYLRSQVPDVNLILENGFVDLREDMAKPEGALVYWFVKRFGKFGFDNAKTLESALYSSEGLMININVRNDQRVSQAVTEKLIDTIRKINRNVISLSYQSSKKDPHSDRYENHKEVFRKVIHHIESNSVGEDEVDRKVMHHIESSSVE